MDIIAEHYEEVVKPTWNAAGRCKAVTEEIMNAALGVAGEAGEVADVIKKSFFHTEKNRREDLKEEIGDVYYYLAVLQHLYGLDTEEILAINKAKLFKRHEVEVG